MESDSSTSDCDSTSDEKTLVTNLHKFYVDTEENKVQTLVQKIQSDMQSATLGDSKLQKTRQLDKVSCKICNDKSNRNDSYIILSCNHIFHVYCLAEKHFESIYKYHVMDNEYLATCKCVTCTKSMGTEELVFLHSKFLNGTKDRIEYHKTAIKTLEDKLKQIKEELRVCYEYKHKLEKQREHSKEIVSSLMTHI